MRVFKRDGSLFQSVGIAPMIPVRRTVAGIAQQKDEVLGRAIAYLKGRFHD